MRTRVISLKPLVRLVAMGAVALAMDARADNVVASYHYAGGAELTRQTNYSIASKLFGLPSSVEFKKLVLRRFADFLATGLPGNGAASGEPLQSLLENWLGAESVGVAGGQNNGPLQFVVAIRLGADAAQNWNAALAKACGRTGDPIQVGPDSGWRWGDGPTAVWLLSTHDWLLAGRGNGLGAERDAFLAQIEKEGLPATPLAGNCLEADVDWARLQQWLPLSLGPLKLARTKIELTATRDNILHMTTKVTYPEAISWNSSPWIAPTKLVFDPLISFTAGRDLAAFMTHDLFHGLEGDPFPQQFYCWAMGEMPFQTYMAWPVPNGTNVIRQLATNLPVAIGPQLKDLNGGELFWSPTHNQIACRSPLLRFVTPTLSPVTTNGQSFLLAALFPPSRRHNNAPTELFSQFSQRNDVVYYDWEITGARLQQWRLLSELLPIVPRITPAQAARERKAVTASTNAPVKSRYIPPFVLGDNWLAGVAPHLNTETITEVDRTGPAELTIKRRSPLLFTAVEWELLTHWMGHSPSVGHIDPHLLPPPAKVSGPGIRPH